MSGWHLQPDVFMPSGESIIRQIRVGNEFFKEHFGEIPILIYNPIFMMERIIISLSLIISTLLIVLAEETLSEVDSFIHF